jgi:hypothetical protein
MISIFIKLLIAAAAYMVGYTIGLSNGRREGYMAGREREKNVR